MSTKRTIRLREQGLMPGYHIYDDVLDTGEEIIYVRFDGVEVVDLSTQSHGVSITIALPRQMARELGLLGPK